MSDALRGQHLHFDCVSGAAGDMTLGALIQLGVPVEVIRAAVERLGLGGERLKVANVVKSGIAAVDVKVDTGADHDHDHDHRHGHDHDHHDHDHHHHTRYRDIKARILGAGLDDEVVRRALDIFDRVARAEAAIHDCSVDEVAFHEVGAIDSIVDIVGAAAALAHLAPASVSCAGVAMGHGQVRCAHGTLPVPAPASLAILIECGGVMLEGGPPRELCTPTGAAILAHAVTRWGPMPDLVPLAVGYGAGDIELPDRANVMRAVVGRTGAAGGGVVYRVEANVDDMSPELCEHAARALFDAGAVDVWWTSILMKNGRPALQLSALAPEAALDAVIGAAVRETTTIGVRFDAVSRRVLERREVWVETAHGRARVKEALADGRVVNAAPEYRDCAALAGETGLPLKAIFAAVSAAYHRSE